jgi:hypothetical protein
MNWKKLLIAFVVVFVVMQILSFIIHELILGASYQELSDLWRPDMDSKMWIMWITGPVFAFFFVFIFVRGFENKGVLEGVRYGLIIACFCSIPQIYGQYMVYDLPYMLVLQWVIYDFITLVIMGIAAALVYKPSATP